MSNKNKYGVVPGYGGEPIYDIMAPFLASDVLSAKSGRYCLYDISDTYWRACNDGENAITAYCDQHFTASTTSGATRAPVAQNVDQFATEVPYATEGAAATLTAAVLATLYGVLCDLYVLSNIQYGDYKGTPADSIFRIVGGDAGNNTLYVVVQEDAIKQLA